MKIVFLAAARRDLVWFKRYYTDVFPAGRQKAEQHYLGMLQLLKTNPKAGMPSRIGVDVRKLTIRRTPFAVLYRLQPERIEILRVYDQRSGFSNESG